MYPQFRSDVAKARSEFTVDAAVIGDGDVTVVEASGGWGTRVLVTASVASERAARILGGRIVVTVHQPWAAAYVLADGGDLHWDYVVEKFAPRGRTCHGGDLFGVAQAIAIVSARPLVGVPEKEEQDA